MRELEKLEQDYERYLWELRKLEDSHDENRKAYRKIEQEETDFDAVNQELNMMINDMQGHWKGDVFYREIGILEEDVADSCRGIRESLTERKEELDRQIKEFSPKEEDCRAELCRIKLRMEE